MSLTMDINEPNSASTNPETTNDAVISTSETQTSEKSRMRILEVKESLLLNLKSILEILTARGGFRAAELTPVGVIYDQLNEILIPENKTE